MDDLHEDPMIRIRWLISMLRSRYSKLVNTPGEPSGVNTFFNGVHVLEKCILTGDPQVEMFLNIVITTAWLSVDEHCQEDFASDDEKIRSMALWRQTFFKATLELKGIEGTCRAMDEANKAMVSAWIAGAMGIDCA